MSTSSTTTIPQAIYFIPGTMCDERLWTKVWATLKENVPAHTQFIHLPIPSLSSIKKITDHLAQHLLENSYIVGFSLGGYFASEIAINFPDKVSKLMLVSNMSSALPAKENKERARTVQWIKSNGYNGIPDKRINHLLDPSSHNVNHIKEVMRAMDKTLGVEVLLHQLKVTTERANLLPQLVELSCPIKFCFGDTDCLVKAERIIEHIQQAKASNTTIEILENTGHMLPLEQPEKFAHIIADWFK